MNFVDFVLLNGRLYPNRPAIMMLDRVVTYGMVANAIHWTCARLHQAGLRPGETVVLSFDNPVRHFVVFCALMRLGIVSLTAGPDAATMAGASAVLTGVANQPQAADVRSIVVDDGWFQPPADDGYPVDPAATDPGRLAVLALTSGTTGRSKPIAFTVAEFESRLRDHALIHSVPGTSRELILMGFAAQLALTEVSRLLACGRTACLAGSAEEAARMIDLYQVEVLFGSPQQLSVLLAALDETPASCASVQLVTLSGAAASAELATSIRRRITRTIAIGYGSTEARKTAMCLLDEADPVPGGVGYVVPSARVEIVDDAGMPLPAGASGRIRILAPAGGRPHVPGTLYPDRTPDWFYPGDVGHLRADGFLVIEGRSDELINAGGLKVAPERIEELVAGRGDIADAAAFGVTGAGGIDEIWLAIVPREPVRSDELIAYCARRSETLAPARIVVVDRIPRNAMGKVERARLKAEAQQR
ncbi:MAG: acyl--CoA ligase [Phreatobacter sp.]|uniref:class I adenylate-forming enzyme family protein n=1 Tax=Phreatobacter sp. TaxID=1966341 RepID=UPI001A3E46B2|nr:class I adenylate-forming enzyme family protein [Phreatobacter sp.]MBL8571366.1 acyl--CoA ligase [Phreatobacter sp.]